MNNGQDHPPPLDPPVPPPLPESAMLPQQPSAETSTVRRLMVILAYMGPLALIPFFFEYRDREVRWHARHGLVLAAIETVLALVEILFVAVVTNLHRPLGWYLDGFFSLAFPWIGILHVACIVKAINRERLVLPPISDLADRFEHPAVRLWHSEGYLEERPDQSARPGPPPLPDTTQQACLPWEQASRFGFVPSLLETAKLLVIQPSEAFSCLHRDGNYLSPLLFATITSLIWFFFFQLTLLVTGRPMSIIDTIIFTVFFPFMNFIGLFIISGLFHLCLMIVRALAHSPMLFEGTFKVMAYSSISLLLFVFPYSSITFLGALIWNLVLMVIGAARAHRVSYLTATGAVVVLFALGCMCMALPWIIYGAAMIASFNDAFGR